MPKIIASMEVLNLFSVDMYDRSSTLAHQDDVSKPKISKYTLYTSQGLSLRKASSRNINLEKSQTQKTD
jgi:hypothetical protein